MNKKELLEKIKVLNPEDDAQRNKFACLLIGHSKIITTRFGYIQCARCDEQIGDALGGYFNGSKSVIVGHNCEKCKENDKLCTWKDKIFCPDPLKEVE